MYPLQPRAQHEGPNTVVNVPGRIREPARVDDRNRAQRPAAPIHAPGLIDHLQGIHVRGRAFGRKVRVVVETADHLVELDELLDVYQTVIEGLQTVLNAHVVERPAGQASRIVAPEKVDQVVVNAAANTVRPPVRVIDQILGNARRATGRLDHGRCVRSHPTLASRPCREPRYRLLLNVSPIVRTVFDGPCEQRAIRDRGSKCHRVRVAGARDDPIQKAGIVLGDQVLLHRAARSADSDGVNGNSEALDEMLLDHHRRLGRDDVVAVVAEDIERRHRHRVSVRNRGHVLQGGTDLALAIPGAAAPAEPVHQAAVPARGGAPWVGEIVRRIVEERNLVNRSIDRARLNSNDEILFMPLCGRRAGNIGRALRGQVKGLEPRRDPGPSSSPLLRFYPVGGSVVVRAPRLDTAVGVRGRPQSSSFGPANEGFLVWSGEHGASARVID